MISHFPFTSKVTSSPCMMPAVHRSQMLLPFIGLVGGRSLCESLRITKSAAEKQLQRLTMKPAGLKCKESLKRPSQFSLQRTFLISFYFRSFVPFQAGQVAQAKLLSDAINL